MRDGRVLKPDAEREKGRDADENVITFNIKPMEIRQSLGHCCLFQVLLHQLYFCNFQLLFHEVFRPFMLQLPWGLGIFLRSSTSSSFAGVRNNVSQKGRELFYLLLKSKRCFICSGHLCTQINSQSTRKSARGTWRLTKRDFFLSLDVCKLHNRWCMLSFNHTCVDTRLEVVCDPSLPSIQSSHWLVDIQKWTWKCFSVLSCLISFSKRKLAQNTLPRGEST